MNKLIFWQFKRKIKSMMKQATNGEPVSFEFFRKGNEREIKVEITVLENGSFRYYEDNVSNEHAQLLISYIEESYAETIKGLDRLDVARCHISVNEIDPSEIKDKVAFYGVKDGQKIKILKDM
jgi:hypothetical protein